MPASFKLSKEALASLGSMEGSVYLPAVERRPAEPRLHLAPKPLWPGWLASIARNRANDFHRRVKPNDEFDEETTSTQIEQPTSSANHSSHSSAEAHAVLDAIRSLPDAYREPLILRLVEGMTGPEIAARTGLTHGSIRVNLHRGMLQLREILGRKTSPPSGGAL